MIFDHDDLQLQLKDVLYFDEKGSKTTKTRARPFCALSLRINGDAKIEKDGRIIHLQKHDLTFFPANTAYMRKAWNDEMIVFHFNITNFVSYDIEVLQLNYDEYLPLFEKALFEWRSREPGGKYRASAVLYEIFALIRSELGVKPEKMSTPVSAAVKYILQNYSDPSLSVTSIAEELHMSGTWLRKLFKSELGIQPKKYINDIRLEYAQSLLNAGYDTVFEVAEKSGFSDTKNFATAYKKRFGYPPSKQGNVR